METSPSNERQQKETTTQYLKRLRGAGFLFHGSNNSQIEELEPRRTYDPNDEENTDTAVFATTNIAWTTIFGIYGGHKGWSTTIKNGNVLAKIPIKD